MTTDPEGRLFDLDPVPTDESRHTGEAVATTLAAWLSSGHLTGDSAAASRRVLQDAALAVDRARAAVQHPRSCPTCHTLLPDSWVGSPYTLAMVARILNELLAAHAPPSRPDEPDPYATGHDVDGLDDVAAAWLRDAQVADTGPGHGQ